MPRTNETRQPAFGEANAACLEVEPVPCALCGSDDARLFASRIVGGVRVRLVRCGSCSLVYANPRITAGSAEKLFDSALYFEGREENLGYYGYLAGEEFLRRTAAARLDRVRHLAPPPADLLEVGSAAGFFLDEAIRLGYRATGIERSAGMADYARRHFGLAVTTADFESFAVPAGSQDVVTMWGVLSLFRRPGEAIRKAAAALRPGGVLALNAFHPELLYPRLARSRWWILTPAMSQVFPARLLEKLLQDEGLCVASRRREAPFTSLLKVLDYLGWRRILRAAISAGLSSAIFRVPLLDCYEYLAVKKVRAPATR